MADIPFAVPDPVGSAVQGVTQGFQLGMAARQASWERKYKQAAFSVELASKPGVPETVKLTALNKGLLPLLNDKRFGINSSGEPIKEFTPESLKNPKLGVLFEKLKKLGEDPDLTPSMKQQFGKQHLLDYYLEEGKSEEATKLQQEMLNDQAKAGEASSKSEDELRKEFIDRPEVKSYVTLGSQVRGMDALLKNGLTGDAKSKAALDQGLITLYNKVLDPTSVVRESEYARTEGNLPAVNRVIGAITKLQEGGAGLTDEDRKALVLGAKIIANSRGGEFNALRSSYEETGKRRGANVENIVGTLPAFTPFVLTPPKSDKVGKGGGAPTTAEEYLKGIGQKNGGR